MNPLQASLLINFPISVFTMALGLWYWIDGDYALAIFQFTLSSFNSGWVLYRIIEFIKDNFS